jgi:hypothetical protein
MLHGSNAVEANPLPQGGHHHSSVPLWLGRRLLLLLLLLLLLRPWRHDSIHARVRDGLAEVFARVPRDHNKGAAVGRLLAKQLERLVQVRIAQ